MIFKKKFSKIGAFLAKSIHFMYFIVCSSGYYQLREDLPEFGGVATLLIWTDTCHLTRFLEKIRENKGLLQMLVEIPILASDC